jgi:formamidopyrimidine-DNA glycosylase
MPELPEVETMRRGILPIVGRTIVDIAWPRIAAKPITVYPSKARFRARTVGQTITAIDRLGKRVVVRLASTDCIIFEPRMTGLVLVADAPTVTHLRFRMHLDSGPIESVWYWDRRGLGNVRLLNQDEQEAQLGAAKLGPDALATSAEILHELFRHSKRPVKVALLDQQRVAGIGNLYASEILHLAGVHPDKRCDLLKRAQWERIHSALMEVLQLAIRYEGSTLSDGTYRNALNKSGGYQNEHRVYDRAGDPCRICGKGHIVRIVQAQRSTFYCPRCQRK